MPVKRISPAASAPINNPIMTIMGNSKNELSSTTCTVIKGSVSNTSRDITVALTAANITGVKPTIVYSIRITSIAKITPARGVLKEAAIPAAAPQATKVRILLLGKCKVCPIKLALAAPKCTLGPSLPMD